MVESRKNIIESLHSVRSLKHKHERWKNIFIKTSGEKAFQECVNYYDELTEKLNEKIVTLPIGFRYIGVFYIKNSYAYEVEFTKYEGTLYVREDLISWEIEKGRKGHEPFLNRYVYLAIFLIHSF